MIAALGLAAAVVAAAIVARLHGLDTGLFLTVNTWHGLPDAVWELLTVAGLGLTGVVIATLAARRRPAALAALAWSFAIGGGLAQAVKRICSTPRPLSVLGAAHVRTVGPELHWNGMPSGHTLTAVAIVVILWVEGGPAFRRPVVALASVALAAAVGVSRIAVGAHFPADVAAGAALGFASAWISIDVARLSRLDRVLARPAGAWAVVALQAGTGVALAVAHTGHPAAVPLQVALGGLALVAAARDATLLAAAHARRGSPPRSRPEAGA